MDPSGLGWNRLSRNAFVTTKTLENAIAPAASMGEKSVPLIGYSAPAATGISTTF